MSKKHSKKSVVNLNRIFSWEEGDKFYQLFSRNHKVLQKSSIKRVFLMKHLRIFLVNIIGYFECNIQF